EQPCLKIEWRRGRDSNPRNACTLNGFRDRPDRPLRHLSVWLVAFPSKGKTRWVAWVGAIWHSRPVPATPCFGPGQVRLGWRAVLDAQGLDRSAPTARY